MKISTGDILEIPTTKGLSYALVVFDYTESPCYGKLVRAFNKKFKERPPLEEIKKLVSGKESFYAFVGFNKINSEEIGVIVLANLGDQGYSYENLPKMWRVKGPFDLKRYVGIPGMPTDPEVIPRRIELLIPGDNTKEVLRYSDINPELFDYSSFSILNILALRDWLESNHSPVDYLKMQWNSKVNTVS
jgi:hypothetical protein